MLINETARQIGNRAEDRIVEVMRSRGLKLLCRNFTVHNVGELDAVFLGGDTVYVVEVRARQYRPGFPTPAETVTPAKRRKINKTTRFLINRYGLYDKNVYFLIAQVALDEYGLVQNIEFVPF